VDWSSLQRAAAGRLDPEVSGLLAGLAAERWGGRAGRDWQIVPTPDEAAWRLYHLLGRAPDGRFRYESLGVRATVAPDGRVVAYQVDNGREFLALADLSEASLARGLRHLERKGLPEQTAPDPPFKAGGRRPAWLRRLRWPGG
jgi:hypothetical protein